MGRETERRRAGSLGEEKRRPVQMLVPRRPGPDRRQRNQVREVQGVDERLADVGVDMAWQAAEPDLDRVHRLADGGGAAEVDDALHRADLLGGTRAALVPVRERSRQVAERYMVNAPHLQRPENGRA